MRLEASFGLATREYPTTELLEKKITLCPEWG